MRRSDYVFFAILSLAWGSNFIFTKITLEYITPIQMVFLRVLFGCIPLIALCVIQKRFRRAHAKYWYHYLVMAISCGSYYYLFAAAIERLHTGIAGALSGAIPMFSFLAALLFLRQEQLGMRKAAGILLGSFGIVLVSKPWQQGLLSVDLLGIAYILLGACAVGVSFVYARKYIIRLGISPLTLSCYQITFALIGLTLATDFQGISNVLSSWDAVLSVALGLGFLGTGMAYILYYILVNRIGAIAAASATYPPAVVAMVIGFFLLDEPLLLLDFLAMALILSGVYLLRPR